jgi:metal-responsive CopG/Arc/MetJ family transcriptional regulator
VDPKWREATVPVDQLPAERRSDPSQAKKTFTVSIDARLDQALDELRTSLGKSSRADVFRLAITLLKLADEARQRGQKLVIADKEDHVLKEILLPG